MNRNIQRSEAKIVVHDRRRHLGSRSRHEKDMRPDAVVMLVRVVAGAAVVAKSLGIGRSRMLMILVIALVRIVIVMVVLDRTNRCISGMIVVARVCCGSTTTAHQVLSSERNEHYQ